MIVVNQNQNTVLYKYDDCKERDNHIKEMCHNGYTCTKIYGYEEIFAEYTKDN